MTVTTTKPSGAAARRTRNRRILAARAAGEGWTSIGDRHGISDRQARRRAAQDARQLAAEEKDWRTRMSLTGGTPDG